MGDDLYIAFSFIELFPNEKMPKKKRPVAQYDKILKENFEAMIPAVMFNVLGITSTQIEPITEDLHYTLERKPDALMRVTDSVRTYILHIEFQTRNDAFMVNRMLEYYALLLRKFQLPIAQYVVYLGNDALSTTDSLHHTDLIYRYNLVSLRDIPYQQFLEADQPEAILLSILSNHQQALPETVIHEILVRLHETPIEPLALERYLQQLRILSILRDYEELFDNTMDHLLEEINFERDPFYKRGYKRGMEVAEKRISKRIAKAEKQAQEAEKQAQEAEKQAQEVYKAEKRETILGLLKLNLPIGQIAAVTRMSEEEIEQISNDLKN